MKNFKKLCRVAVFTLVLTNTTFAGEIDTGGKTPPPPPPSTIVSGESAIEPNASANDEYQLLEDILPDLFLVMLSVF